MKKILFFIAFKTQVDFSYFDMKQKVKKYAAYAVISE